MTNSTGSRIQISCSPVRLLLNMRTAVLTGILLSAIIRTAAAADKLGKFPEQSPVINTGHILFSLALVLVVIFLGAGIFRWLGRFPVSTSRIIRIVGSANVGPRERIVLIEIDNTQLLVGVTSGHVQTLHVMNPPISAHTADPHKLDTSHFRDRLNTFLGIKTAS